jgi:hypothetical protein
MKWIFNKSCYEHNRHYVHLTFCCNI